MVLFPPHSLISVAHSIILKNAILYFDCIYNVCCIEMSYHLNGNIHVEPSVDIGESEVVVFFKDRAYLVPIAFVQPYDVPSDGGGEEKTRTGGKDSGILSLREKPNDPFMTVVFFNEFDLFGDKVDPFVEGRGVSANVTSNYDIPLITLLREAKGAAVWKEKTDPGLYLYSAFKDRDVWKQNSLLDPNKSLRQLNLLPDGNLGDKVYIMISSKKPKYVNPAYRRGTPLPASLRGLGVKLGQPKVW